MCYEPVPQRLKKTGVSSTDAYPGSVSLKPGRVSTRLSAKPPMLLNATLYGQSGIEKVAFRSLQHAISPLRSVLMI